MHALSRRALSDDLRLAATLEPWIEALREEALARLCHGEIVPEHKLVAKRAIRKWIDDAAAQAAVVAAAKANEKITKVEVMSPAQAEKEAPGVDLSPYWTKQSSGVTLAHESDPRPAVEAPKSTLLEDLKGSLE